MGATFRHDRRQCIGLFYYLRIIYRMLTPLEHYEPMREAGLKELLSHCVLFVLLCALIALGVYPNGLMSLLESVVATL